MNLRRLAMIATRLLAVYLFVRGLGNVDQIGFDWGQDGAVRWISIVSFGVPLIAAAVLWLTAEPMAARLAKGFPLSNAEIDRALAAEEAEVDDVIAARDDALEVDETISSAWLSGALMVLGALLVARGVGFVASDVAQLALFRHLGFCEPALSSFRGSGSCSFFNPQTTRVLVSLGAGAVQLAFGVWFIIDPAGFLDRVRRIFRRYARIDPGEEMVFEEDVER